jgi:hypothetical protein
MGANMGLSPAKCRFVNGVATLDAGREISGITKSVAKNCVLGNLGNTN